MAYVNIPAWHSMGYKGKKKDGNPVVVFLDDTSVEGHYGFSKNIGASIMPEGTVLSGMISTTESNGAINSATIFCRELNVTMPFDDFIQTYNVRIINNSKDGGNHNTNSSKAMYLRSKREQHNLILTGSAGNGYGLPIDNSYLGAAYMITGVYDMRLKSTYAKDAGIDFTAFTAGRDGTSFAAPFFAYMAALLVCKYPNITHSEVGEYFALNNKDLGVTGADDVYGKGLAMMGQPLKAKQTITAELGETPVKVLPSGEIKVVERIFYQNRNYFLLRDFEDSLGLIDVEYDAVNNLPTVED